MNTLCRYSAAFLLGAFTAGVSAVLRLPAAGVLAFACLVVGIVQLVRRKPSMVWWMVLLGEIAIIPVLVGWMFLKQRQ